MTMRSLACLLLTLLAPTLSAQAKVHPVVTSTPDLGALARAVGGGTVEVTTFVVGPQDPHYLDPRPTMLYALQRCELSVEIGRELESGWLPVLQRQSRNPSVLPGQIGQLDASRAVRTLGMPTAGTDRSAGDLHQAGNPHYLSDPLCGLQVAALLRDRFAALWPDQKDAFVQAFETFRQRLAVAMVGEDLARLYDHDAEQLALAFGNGQLLPMLDQQGDRQKLGGWFAALAPLRGSKVVVDHDLWPYFAERFGLVVIGFLEPKPGVTPTTAHLATLADRMRKDGVRVVLATPYFPVQFANSLRESVGAVVAPMAHQPGARPGTDDYIAFVDHNVKTLVAALTPSGTTKQ